MDNMEKIKKFSKKFHWLLSLFMVLAPLYYILYWVFINQLPEPLVTVNTTPTPVAPHQLPAMLQLAGFAASLLPLAALLYGLANIRKLFAYYMEGVIFSLEQVRLFRNIAKVIILWVVFSVLYDSVKSILFSLGNPPGQRVVSIGFGTEEISTLVVGLIAFLIAWVMEEGRLIDEENRLIV